MSSQAIDGVATHIPLHKVSASSFQSGPAGTVGNGESVEPSQAKQSVVRPTDQQIQQAVHDLQKAIAPLAAELRFSIDEDTGRTVVRVLDTATRKVLKQFPSEEILQVSKSIEKFRLGLLVDKQV